jgi:hypothetical protein
MSTMIVENARNEIIGASEGEDNITGPAGVSRSWTIELE